MADKRIFVLEGREYPDPDSSLSVEEVRGFYAAQLPELHNASSTETERMSKDVPPVKERVIVFSKRVGTKG